MVQLTEELVRQLDAQAQSRGISRSALIRDILEGALCEGLEAEIDRRIVEGYRRIPPGTPDGWGDIDASADLSAVDALRRLDAEERDAGFEPW